MGKGRWCDSRGAESAPLIRYIIVADGDEATHFALQGVVHCQFSLASVASLSYPLWLQAKVEPEVVPKLLC